MIACPACKRRVIARGEILGANLDSAATCPACGQVSHLDAASRCFVGCLLALLLWLMLLQGNFFYSGYLFLFSTIVIFAGWRLISAAALPFLTLEKAPRRACFDRRQTVLTFVLLIVLAIIIDGLLSYRSDADKAYANTTSASGGGP